MNLFDIMGPVMVGPSSSHTAGAVRMGYVARKLLGFQPARANIALHGSFAATGAGHGTDRALAAGPRDAVCVTGSLYMIGEVRHLLGLC